MQEGEANTRYREQQQKTLDKTVRLRALRLAHPPEETKPAKRSSVTSERRLLPGLHQGVRE
jgi:hypothetical protein